MLATEGAAREAAGHDLRERGESGRDAEVRLRTTGRVAETRDPLVEDERHAVARRQCPELLEVTRDGRRRPGLAARGLEDDRGDVAALESDLDRLDVVGRADHDLLERRARHARRHGHLVRRGPPRAGAARPAREGGPRAPGPWPPPAPAGHGPG